MQTLDSYLFAGIYNISQNGVDVFKALSPSYMCDVGFFVGWEVLVVM